VLIAVVRTGYTLL